MTEQKTRKFYLFIYLFIYWKSVHGPGQGITYIADKQYFLLETILVF